MIGFGFMGGVHLSAIEHIEGATLTAISSRTRPMRDTPSRGNLPHLTPAILPPEAKWYSDWQELLQDPDVDAVDICLPTYLHKQVAISALEKGKHVLCEKPMALTPSDCDQILEAASRSDRTFMVGQVLRFASPYRYAASFITSIGRSSVKACILKRKTGYPQWSEWLSNEERSGGAILDLLIHDIDLALELFGQPTTVSAVRQGEIDTMLGTLRYPNGLEVQIEGGWHQPELPFSAGYEIADEDAALRFEDGKLTLTKSGAKTSIDMPEHQEYLEQMLYFLDCCRNNTAPELCPPVESARAVKVATLLKASRDQNGMAMSCKI